MNIESIVLYHLVKVSFEKLEMIQFNIYITKGLSSLWACNYNSPHVDGEIPNITLPLVHVNMNIRTNTGRIRTIASVKYGRRP